MKTHGYLRAEDCRLPDLVRVLEAGSADDLRAYPNADRSEHAAGANPRLAEHAARRRTR